MNRPTMTDEEFVLFRDLIYALCGIHFSDKKYSLANKIAPLFEKHGSKSYHEFYRFLTLDPRGKQELAGLIDAITVHETFFFREPQQFRVLSTHIFSEFVNKRLFGPKKLKIWSAACSSGEEAYTMALLAKETQVLRNWQVEIAATDLSRTILQRAQQGVYTEYAMKNLKGALEVYKTKYFTKVSTDRGERYRILPTVKAAVRFSQVNLANERQMRFMRGFDVIFCRNVLIYFDQASKAKVIEYLYDSLAPGGYLFLSVTEWLFGVKHGLKPVTLDGCTLYRKEEK